MKARLVAAAATGAVGLLLGGCTLPDGVDGELTDGWQSMAEPVGFVPEVGTCHTQDYATQSTLNTYSPVDCAGEHVTETVYVAEFGDGTAGADLAAPPETGSAEWQTAYSACDDAADSYLGADFRSARLWLGVVVPSGEAWEGGARWFRCDVIEFEDEIQYDFTRSGSLAGVLAEDGAGLRLGCFEVAVTEDDEIERMDPVGCDEAHHAEFVGVWQAPEGDYLAGDDEESAERVHSGCREQVAEYVDVPVDGDLQFRTGTIADWMDEGDWGNGDRGFRCYLWLNGDELTESLKDAGPDALPVR
jgi:putative regulator of septum formation